MTDITTTLISFRRLSLLHLQLPKLGIGRTVEATSRSIIKAFAMAYVAPFTPMQHKPSIAFDEDLEGRDANW